MNFRAIVSSVTLAVTASSSVAQSQLVERDPQNRFAVSRPAAWVNQDKPFSTIRVMLGIEGDGYVGNCNISVLPSRSTAKLTQAEVDTSENKQALGTDFFLPKLLAISTDVKVLSATLVKRGDQFGQLVNYTYSYMSPSLQRRIHMRAELFSHSRPGKVFSFTCNTGALSPADAQRAFSAERKNFEALAASLRVDD